MFNGAFSSRFFRTKIRPRMTPIELMEHARDTKTFDRLLKKVNIVSMENGNGIAEFTVAPEHTNNYNRLSMGFTTTLVDFVSSFSFSSHPRGNNFHVSTNINVDFYHPEVYVGDQIEVEAKTMQAGGHVAFLEVILKNKKTGTLLAKGIHNMFIMNVKEK